MHALTRGLRSFAHQHDDVPAFHAGFLVATILSAAVLNLGFFAIAIVLHMTLDFVKYRDLHRYDLKTTCKAIILESVADIALFLIALTFAVYLNHTYMLAAMSGMLRSELTVLRAVGMLIPKVRMVENILAILLNFHNYMHSVHPDLARPITRVQRWSICTIVVCSALLLLAVFLYQSNGWSLVKVLMHELVPAI
jgi:hypothetical protein